MLRGVWCIGTRGKHLMAGQLMGTGDVLRGADVLEMQRLGGVVGLYDIVLLIVLYSFIDWVV
jgi:hypothetical protein